MTYLSDLLTTTPAWCLPLDETSGTVAADEYKSYFFANGAGGLIDTSSSLGTWAGDLGVGDYTVIGEGTDFTWSGCLAHAALFGSVLSLADFTALATL